MASLITKKSPTFVLTKQAFDSEVLFAISEHELRERSIANDGAESTPHPFSRPKLSINEAATCRSLPSFKIVESMRASFSISLK